MNSTDGILGNNLVHFLLSPVLIGTIVGVLAHRMVLRKRGSNSWIAVFVGVGGSLLISAFDVNPPAAYFVSLILGATISLGTYQLFRWLRAMIRRLAKVQSSPVATSFETRDKGIVATVSHASIGEIFISYASANRQTARALAHALRDVGWSVWWDRTIPPGKSFDQVIETALNAAKCVIVLWSRTSVTSDWVKVEAAEGARRRILIPVLIEEVTIPLEFRRLEAADLTDWPASPASLGLQNLKDSIADILGKPSASESRPSVG
jgi:uncharacterized membrane protein YeaQ/YmgE (transglycosylase-associated protein family)